MRPTLGFPSIILISSVALAQPEGRIGYLTRSLEKGGDPRVRAQAALLLGASQDATVLAPLCRALTDEAEIVRSSAARGLAALKDARAIDCLNARLRTETSGAQQALRHAVEELVAVRDRPVQLYIALAAVADKTSTVDAELIHYTEESLRARLASMGGMFAPPQETAAAARAVLQSRKLKGFYLRIGVDQLPTGEIKMNLVCFTYPDRALLGEVNVKASGGKPADLIRALTPKVLEEAAQTFDWSL